NGFTQGLKRFQSPTDCTPAGSTSDRGKRGDQKEKGKEIQKVKRFTNRNKDTGKKAAGRNRHQITRKEWKKNGEKE
ncbi:hypothetical protein, partial [Bacteroides heparinolyticus]|uniref:hypothetical protein n=1 Tax=Prevotella heparinolytica TaxID=28113 RepID=UPI0035A0412E